MSDRELLENAAKAYGLDGWKWCKTFGGMKSPRKKTPYGYATSFWNPLRDDSDAFRLAVRLGMAVKVYDMTGMTMAYPMGSFSDYGADEAHGDDPYAATRRAIVRAASSIGGKLT